MRIILIFLFFIPIISLGEVRLSDRFIPVEAEKPFLFSEIPFICDSCQVQQVQQVRKKGKRLIKQSLFLKEYLKDEQGEFLIETMAGVLQRNFDLARPIIFDIQNNINKFVSQQGNSQIVGFYRQPFFSRDSCVYQGKEVICSLSSIRSYLAYGLIPWWALKQYPVYIDEFMRDVDPQLFDKFVVALLEAATEGIVELKGIGYFNVPNPDGQPDKISFSVGIVELERNVRQFEDSTYFHQGYGFPVDEEGKEIVIPEGYSITDDCVIDYINQTFNCLINKGIPGISLNNLFYLKKGVRNNCFQVKIVKDDGMVFYQIRPKVDEDEDGLPDLYPFIYDYYVQLKQPNNVVYGKKLFLNTAHVPGIVWVHGGSPPNDWNGGIELGINGYLVSSFLDGMEKTPGGYEATYCPDDYQEIDFASIQETIDDYGNLLWGGMLGEENPDYTETQTMEDVGADYSLESEHNATITRNFATLFINHKEAEINQKYEEHWDSVIGNMFEKEWDGKFGGIDVPIPRASDGKWFGNERVFSSGETVISTSIDALLELAQIQGTLGLYVIPKGGSPETIFYPRTGTIHFSGDTFWEGEKVFVEQWETCSLPFLDKCPPSIVTFQGCVYNVNGEIVSCGMLRRGTRQIPMVPIPMYDDSEISIDVDKNIIRDFTVEEKKRMLLYSYGVPVGMEPVRMNPYAPLEGAWLFLTFPEELVVGGMEMSGVTEDEVALMQKYINSGMDPYEASEQAFNEASRNAFMLTMVPLVVLMFTPAEWVAVVKGFAKGTIDLSKEMASKVVTKAWAPKMKESEKIANLNWFLKNGVFSQLILKLDDLVYKANRLALDANQALREFQEFAKRYEHQLDLQGAVNIKLSEGENFGSLRQEVADKYGNDLEELKEKTDTLMMSFEELIEIRKAAYLAQQEIGRFCFKAGLPDLYARNWDIFFKKIEADRFPETVTTLRITEKSDRGRLDVINMTDITPEVLKNTHFEIPLDILNEPDPKKRAGRERLFLARKYEEFRERVEYISPVFRDLAELSTEELKGLRELTNNLKRNRVEIDYMPQPIVIAGVGMNQHLLSMREYIQDFQFFTRVELGNRLRNADTLFEDRDKYMSILWKRAMKLKEESDKLLKNGGSESDALFLLKKSQILQGRLRYLKVGIEFETEILENAIVVLSGKIAQSNQFLKEVNAHLQAIGLKPDWVSKPRGREATPDELAAMFYNPKMHRYITERLRPRRGDGPVIGVIGSRHIYKAKGVGDIVMGLRPCRIVSGTCRGADQIGEAIADFYGLPVHYLPAPWEKYKKALGYKGAAGPDRNTQIVYYSDIIVAIGSSWNSSRGTLDTMQKALAMGKPVYFHDIKGINSGWIDKAHPAWPLSHVPMPSVVSKYASDFNPHDPSIVYIMRETSVPLEARGRLGGNGIFGNPFKEGIDGTREEIIEKFKRFRMPELRKTEEFKQLVNKWVYESDGVKLACCCKPQPCHGDVIAEEMRKAVVEGWMPSKNKPVRDREIKMPDESNRMQVPERQPLPLNFHPHLMTDDVGNGFRRGYRFPNFRKECANDNEFGSDNYYVCFAQKQYQWAVNQ